MTSTQSASTYATSHAASSHFRLINEAELGLGDDAGPRISDIHYRQLRERVAFKAKQSFLTGDERLAPSIPNLTHCMKSYQTSLTSIIPQLAFQPNPHRLIDALIR